VGGVGLVELPAPDRLETARTDDTEKTWMAGFAGSNGGWKLLACWKNLSYRVAALELTPYYAYLPFVHATCMEWIEQ
jgi:hypothetical protein